MSKYYITDSELIYEVSENAFGLLEHHHFDSSIGFEQFLDKVTITRTCQDDIEIEVFTIDSMIEQIAEKLGLEQEVARKIVYALRRNRYVNIINIG